MPISIKKSSSERLLKVVYKIYSMKYSFKQFLFARLCLKSGPSLTGAPFDKPIASYAFNINTTMFYLRLALKIARIYRET